MAESSLTGAPTEGRTTGEGAAAAAETKFSEETTAEAATLGPPEEEKQVVATGPEPDSVLPAADSPAETISTAPADPG